MNNWIKGEPISCGKLMRWRASVIEWSIDYEKCPNCGAGKRNYREFHERVKR